MILFSSSIKMGAKIDEYTIKQRLGEGRYGVCYLVEYSNEEYILKLLKTSMQKKSMGKVLFEQEILDRLNHPSIPRLIRVLNINRSRGYILEHKQGKTAEQMILMRNIGLKDAKY